MTDPRYRDVKAADVPPVELPGGALVRVIAGRVGTAEGPVRGIVTDPEYLDVTLPRGASLSHPVGRDRNTFAYVFEGQAFFGSARERRQVGPHRDGTLVRLGEGDLVEARQDGGGPARFLLVSGRPLREPVAWRGPIVMNTEEELRTAFEEYRAGTFLKVGGRR
ncbi:MAG: pirin family protein [Deltaproteobacteria bacterium]|nr:pirin family protein [Deltaproteobacteria bacterium]